MSTDVPNAGFGVSADDIRAYDWQPVIQTSARRECDSYSEVLAANLFVA